MAATTKKQIGVSHRRLNFHGAPEFWGHLVGLYINRATIRMGNCPRARSSNVGVYTFHEASDGAVAESLERWTGGIANCLIAAEYGDAGRDHVGHIAKVSASRVANRCGLGWPISPRAIHLTRPPARKDATARARTHSRGRTTTTGNWERAGNLACPRRFGLQARLSAVNDRAVEVRHWARKNEWQPATPPAPRISKN